MAAQIGSLPSPAQAAPELNTVINEKNGVAHVIDGSLAAITALALYWRLRSEQAPDAAPATTAAANSGARGDPDASVGQAPGDLGAELREDAPSPDGSTVAKSSHARKASGSNGAKSYNH